MQRRFVTVALLATALVFVAVPSAPTAVGVDSKPLRDAVTTAGMQRI